MEWKDLDQKRLAETLRLSYQGSNLWKQTLETARTSPAPLTFFDGTILMAPIVILRGTKICVDFYKQAFAELQDFIANKDDTRYH